MPTQSGKTRKTTGKRTTRPARDIPGEIAELERKAEKLSPDELRAQVDRLVDRIEDSRRALARERERLDALLEENQAPKGTKRHGEAPATAESQAKRGGEPPPQGERVERSFSEFLTEIGSAFSQAQSALDRESAAYLASGPMPFPTVFRLPRLTADMKFAIEKQGSRGINLVFYSSRGSERELNQQSIQFELVAAPPPPGFAAPAPVEAMLGPGLDLVTRAAERTALLQSANNQVLRVALNLDAGAFEREQRRIVIWAARPPAAAGATDTAAFLVGHAPRQGGTPALAIVEARRQSAGGPVARIEDAKTLLGDPRDAPFLAVFRGFLTAAADWQESQLPASP